MLGETSVRVWRVSRVWCECGGRRSAVVGSETANGDQKEKKKTEKSRQTEPFGGFKFSVSSVSVRAVEMSYSMLEHDNAPARFTFHCSHICRCLMKNMKMTGFQFFLNIH